MVDTNVWVSALLNPKGAPARILAALVADRFTPVTSEPLLAELADVLTRPRIVRKYGVQAEDVGALVALLRQRARLVPVRGHLRVCRDPDDDLVIETALRGRATALVTRDDDLKRAGEVIEVLAAAGIPVLTVQAFLDALGEANDGRASLA